MLCTRKPYEETNELGRLRVVEHGDSSVGFFRPIAEVNIIPDDDTGSTVDMRIALHGAAVVVATGFLALLAFAWLLAVLTTRKWLELTPGVLVIGFLAYSISFGWFSHKATQIIGAVEDLVAATGQSQ
jgi:hypothetical protein